MNPTQLYVIKVNQPRRSEHDDQRFFEITMIDDNLNEYQTFVVETYRNFKYWRDIIAVAQEGKVVRIEGVFVIKPHTNPPQIDADSTPRFCDAHDVSEFADVVEHKILDIKKPH